MLIGGQRKLSRVREGETEAPSSQLTTQCEDSAPPLFCTRLISTNARLIVASRDGTPLRVQRVKMTAITAVKETSRRPLIRPALLSLHAIPRTFFSCLVLGQGARLGLPTGRRPDARLACVSRRPRPPQAWAPAFGAVVSPPFNAVAALQILGPSSELICERRDGCPSRDRCQQ